MPRVAPVILRASAHRPLSQPVSHRPPRRNAGLDDTHNAALPLSENSFSRYDMVVREVAIGGLERLWMYAEGWCKVFQGINASAQVVAILDHSIRLGSARSEPASIASTLALCITEDGPVIGNGGDRTDASDYWTS